MAPWAALSLESPKADLDVATLNIVWQSLGGSPNTTKYLRQRWMGDSMLDVLSVKPGIDQLQKKKDAKKHVE